MEVGVGSTHPAIECCFVSSAGSGILNYAMSIFLQVLLAASLLACASGRGQEGTGPWSGPIRDSGWLGRDSGEVSVPRPLFQTDQPLVITLEADFHQLRKDREQESEERPGRVYLNDVTGEESYPVEVRTRGRFRLNDYICSSPPLRLDFPTDSVKGSPLEGLDKVKLVGHCRDRDSYEQNVLEEYLAYRIYGLLTDVGFRVQLALITYRDVSGLEDEISRLGFLIESEEALARRLGGEMIEADQVHPNRLVPQQAGLMYLFQFLIGNTDWAVVHSHNMKFLQVGADYHPVPYDFDFSGLVDAPYAGPSPVVSQYIATVRERYFWGVCSDEIDYTALIAHFNEARQAIVDLIDNQRGLSGWNRRQALSYVDSFYETINDQRAADFLFQHGCRPVRGP
jgi:hypothetical protein